jgi:hypothetical protein
MTREPGTSTARLEQLGSSTCTRSTEEGAAKVYGTADISSHRRPMCGLTSVAQARETCRHGQSSARRAHCPDAWNAAHSSGVERRDSGAPALRFKLATSTGSTWFTATEYVRSPLRTSNNRRGARKVYFGGPTASFPPSGERDRTLPVRDHDVSRSTSGSGQSAMVGRESWSVPGFAK